IVDARGTTSLVVAVLPLTQNAPSVQPRWARLDNLALRGKLRILRLRRNTFVGGAPLGVGADSRLARQASHQIIGAVHSQLAAVAESTHLAPQNIAADLHLVALVGHAGK